MALEWIFAHIAKRAKVAIMMRKLVCTLAQH